MGVIVWSSPTMAFGAFDLTMLWELLYGAAQTMAFEAFDLAML